MTRSDPTEPWNVIVDVAAGDRHDRRTVLADLRRAPRLAWEIVRRDNRARYRSARFGVVLALAPAAGIAAWAVLVQSSGAVDLGGVLAPYPLFVTVSVVLWQGFTEALCLQVEGLRAERAMLLHHAVPAEGVALAKSADAAFSLAIKLLLVVVVITMTGTRIGPSLALLPVVGCAAVLAGTAVGMLLAPLSLIYRDISLGLSPVLVALFFVTPVIFPIPPDGALRAAFVANPLTPILELGRATVLGTPLPEPTVTWVTTAFWTALLVGAWWLYRVALPHVLERTDS